MSELRYLQVDVFAERAGGGNPLGVVLGADAWNSEDMQRFAAWMNLVETTFVLAPTHPDASYRLRIFTPAKEIPFAGHPTVGSAHAALESGRVAARDGMLLQECGAGLLPIRVEGEGADRRIYVQAPAARILREGGDDALRKVLGTLRLGTLPPAFVEGGRRWWLAELAQESDLRAWQPDHPAIKALATASDSLGLCVFARAARKDQLEMPARAAREDQVEAPARAARKDQLEMPARAAREDQVEAPARAAREDQSEMPARAARKDQAEMPARAKREDTENVPARSARDDPNEPYQLVVRAFPAGVGIIEDPASGAANGLIAAYIAQREATGELARGYRVSQGREIGHDATIDVRIDESPVAGAAGAVWVGGRSWTVIDGIVVRRIEG
jgi:PhzF family phenazine biosynthesis protein